MFPNSCRQNEKIQLLDLIRGPKSRLSSSCMQYSKWKDFDKQGQEVDRKHSPKMLENAQMDKCICSNQICNNQNHLLNNKQEIVRVPSH